MANFSPFKFTTKGLDLEYEVQAGKVLNFSKFVLGDGYYTGSIRDLTSLVNFVREEPITRMEITGVGNKKRIRIGFDLDTTKITNGFYLREIGIIAIDPDTQEEVLMFYTNAGETADYITNDTSSTITTKLINAEIYVSDVAEITANIDDSLVYALKSEFNAFKSEVVQIITDIQDNLPTKTSDLEKDDVYTKEEVDNAIENYASQLSDVAVSGNYNDLINKPIMQLDSVNLVDGTAPEVFGLTPKMLYKINTLSVNGQSITDFTHSVVHVTNDGVHTDIALITSRNTAGGNSTSLEQKIRLRNFIRYTNAEGTYVHESDTITYTMNDTYVANETPLSTRDIVLVYEY